MRKTARRVTAIVNVPARKKAKVALCTAVIAAGFVLTGCTAPTAEETAPHVEQTPSEVTEQTAGPEPTPEPTPEPALGATESFRAWLEASRIPEVDEACATLAPELVTRMLAEMAESGIEASSCEEMITVTADLYRAFDQNADITIASVSETETDAVLHVTYLASGDCGTVVMTRPASEWIITEQTQETCE
ncbi:hypothetical protein [Microbacterium sp. A84]|uniref:hypothetical protein n=1 Tax=Microbacterium sp. A84 TaxID=3450715 RepID=UPI003F433A3A